MRIMFVDRVTLYVKGGDGGAGCCSFRREKYVPKGGPDGGDGGDGGDVIVRAVAGTDSLAEIVNRKHWRAPTAAAGAARQLPRPARPTTSSSPVPPGTLIFDRDRGNVLRDLTEAGQQVIVAQRRPRRPRQQGFATATNRAPRETQPGTPGEERWIVLELKVIADAGLIGLPNAGKSTLLSRLSHAQPEIADYPFTTKHPNLGLVTHRRRTGLRPGRSARPDRRRPQRRRPGTRIPAPRRTDPRAGPPGRAVARRRQRSADTTTASSAASWSCTAGRWPTSRRSWPSARPS